MKTVHWNTLALALGVIALAVGGPWLVGQLQSLPGRKALAARAGERVVVLELGGMTCAGCAATIEGQLTTVPGVSAVEVRLQQERAYVVCEPALADSVLLTAVRRAGPGFAAMVVAP